MRSQYTITVAHDARPAIADLLPYESGWLITRINVPKSARHLGYGTTLLNRILADADDQGVELWVHPTASGGLSQRQLVSWYIRHGFNKRADGQMLRYPHYHYV